MEDYLSLLGETRSEKTIERSKFFTLSAHIEGEEDAARLLSRVRAENPDATHNCYAYIGDEAGNLLRFSDDGEPSGTAGMPILDVLKNQNLKMSLVVVTRYFGGIKLGAGGLVRAYSSCAAENLKEAKRAVYTMCIRKVYRMDYSLLGSFKNIFARIGVEVSDISYGEQVEAAADIKKTDEKKVDEAVSDGLSGRVKIETLKEFVKGFSAK